MLLFCAVREAGYGPKRHFAAPKMCIRDSLETEVTQSTAQVVVDGNGLRLQQLTMGQQHPQFLTA